MTIEEVDERIDMRLGVLIEHMNDQFERVIEVIDQRTAPIPKVLERLDRIESRLDHIETDVIILRKKIEE